MVNGAAERKKNAVITDNLNGMNGFIRRSESPICEVQETFDD
jgi:hypothetical protein